jgi:AraC-like DNA-binding protein/mannose-6-phosphate isomerase-like protein (cupin superfamily)
MADTVTPKTSARYRGRFAVTAPEVGIPYLTEAALSMTGPHDRHAHAEIQILFVIEGEMGMDVGRHRVRVGPGAGLVMLPGKRHRVNTPGPEVTDARAEIIDLRLTDGAGWPLATFARSVPAHRANQGDPAAVADGAKRLAAALETHGPARTARLLSAVWEMLAELAAEPAAAAAVDLPAGHDARPAVAEQFMADHLSDPIDVESVAGAVGLSRSQLTRLLMKHRGIGPAHLLRKMRVDRARHLLRTSTLSIKEIARVCGFATQHHFSRVFFEETGTRPSTERISPDLLATGGGSIAGATGVGANGSSAATGPATAGRPGGPVGGTAALLAGGADDSDDEEDDRADIDEVDREDAVAVNGEHAAASHA